MQFDLRHERLRHSFAGLPLAGLAPAQETRDASLLTEVDRGRDHALIGDVRVALVRCSSRGAVAVCLPLGAAVDTECGGIAECVENHAPKKWARESNDDGHGKISYC